MHPYTTYLGNENQGYSHLEAGPKRRIQQNLETDSVLEQGQELVPELSYMNKLVRNDV
jgi:hypothetical protein